ncbi:MAG: DUF3343 domain-containing protein [Coriobacteriales bacterium]|nr:DUF3343 domain-containing protein [Actinomycetes bacterium]
MSESHAFVVYGFSSTHDALSGEKLLEQARIACVTIPAPRELGEMCGLALRVCEGDAEAADAALAAGGLHPSGRIRFFDRAPES